MDRLCGLAPGHDGGQHGGLVPGVKLANLRLGEPEAQRSSKRAFVVCEEPAPRGVREVLAEALEAANAVDPAITRQGPHTGRRSVHGRATLLGDDASVLLQGREGFEDIPLGCVMHHLDEPRCAHGCRGQHELDPPRKVVLELGDDERLAELPSEAVGGAGAHTERVCDIALRRGVGPDLLVVRALEETGEVLEGDAEEGGDPDGRPQQREDDARDELALGDSLVWELGWRVHEGKCSGLGWRVNSLRHFWRKVFDRVAPSLQSPYERSG